MINDSGYIYFLMLIAPIMVAFGIPYETMKFFKWASISIITFFVLQRVLLAKGSFIIPKTRLINFMLFFLGLALITTAFSSDVSKSILELLRILSIFALFLLVFNTLECKRDIQKLIRMWLFVFGLHALYGTWQYFGEGIGRIHSTFATANGLGDFCFLTTPLIASLLTYRTARNQRVFYSLLFCLLMLTLFLTGSRASWLSSLVALTVVGILAKNKKLVFAIFFVLITVVSAGIISPALRSIFENTIRLSSGLTYRPLLWASCFNLIKDHWLLGVGLNALGEILPQYSAIRIPALQVSLSGILRSGSVHNLYLQTIAQMGIVGVIVLIYFFKVGLTEIKLRLKREKDPYLKALLTAGIALIVATFVHAFFETSNIIGGGTYSTYFWILLGSIYSIDKIRRKKATR